MVAWYWLIMAFFTGSVVTFLLTALNPVWYCLTYLGYRANFEKSDNVTSNERTED